MNKGIVLLVILVAAVFLTGCTTGGQTRTVGATYIGGTEGLKVSFLPGSPPERTTDGSTGGFSIVIKAENVGESSIAASDGYVQIWGLDASSYGSAYPDFKKSFSQQDGFGSEIRGAVMNFDGSVLNGGISTIDFGDLRYTPIIQGDITQTIVADVCYKYTTKATTQLCVKSSNEEAFSGTKICQVEGEKNPQNSGAPIHVTSLKESFIGNGRIGITLTLTHVGNGDNFFRDNLGVCNDVESNLEKGKVRVTFSNVAIGGRSVPVVCQGIGTDGYVRLFKDGSGRETTTIYCTIDVSGSNNVVQVPVDVSLSYLYLQHIEKDLVIRHVTQG